MPDTPKRCRFRRPWFPHRTMGGAPILTFHLDASVEGSTRICEIARPMREERGVLARGFLDAVSSRAWMICPNDGFQSDFHCATERNRKLGANQNP